MQRTADAIVIGGGVHGTSTSYHLARKGLRVEQLEARHLTAGASGKSSALVRMHYTVQEEVQLAWESWKYFSNWKEIVGGECDFRQTGFARLVAREHQDKLRANVAIMQGLGIETRIISADELRQIDPGVWLDDVDIAAYEPLSGYADPSSTCQAMLAAARALGASYQDESPVLEVLVDGQKVTGVRTAKETIAAPIVVIAAGNGSKRLCTGLGIDLPVWPFYIKTAFFDRPADFGPRHLVYIDGPSGIYFRPEGANLTLVGGSVWDVRVEDPDTDTTTIDLEFIGSIGALLSRRFPAMERAGSRGGDLGYDTMSRDGHPIVGRLPEYDGLYIQTGMSGTGFKISPAVGRNLAESIVEGRWAEVNLDIFSPTRFAEGRRVAGPHEYRDHGEAEEEATANTGHYGL